MKKILLTLFLLLAPSAAFAQCNGVFPAKTLCGNLGASPAPPSAFSAGGTVVGPSSSTVGDIAVWNNTTGTLLKDVPPLQIFGTNSANCIYAGPASGSAAYPTCRAMVIADLPTAIPYTNLATISSSYILGNFSGSTTTPSAQQVPSCANDGFHALTNNSGSGFNCTSISNSFFTPGYTTLSWNGSAWVCYGPTGNSISTSGTTTSGLQECWNSAKTNYTNFRANCLAFFANKPITATTTVTIGAVDGTLIDLRGCYLNSSAATGLIIDSLEFSSVLDWSSGYILCTGATSTCVNIDPTNAGPSGVYGIGWSTVKLPAIIISCTSTGANSYGVHINPGNGPAASSHNAAIYGSYISIAAIDGYDGSHYCPIDGLGVDNPTNAYAAFAQDYIWIGYIQGVDTIYLANGTGAVTQATQALGTNQWHIGNIGTNGSPSYGVLTYGFLDYWNTDISVNAGSLTTGFSFGATTANGNWFFIPQLAGTTPLNDSGTSVKNYGFYNGTGYKTGGSF